MTGFSIVRRLSSLLVVFITLLLAGCAPSVVGKWEGNISANGVQLPVVMEFKPDGKMTHTMSVPIGKVIMRGDYKVEGDKITLNLTEIDAFGKKSQSPGPGVAKGDMNFKFEGEKLILTDTGAQPLTLERVK